MARGFSNVSTTQPRTTLSEEDNVCSSQDFGRPLTSSSIATMRSATGLMCSRVCERLRAGESNHESIGKHRFPQGLQDLTAIDTAIAHL